MAFKIIVCAKQVPDTNEIKIDPVKKTLIREGVPSILNHDDANALEEALKIKDKYPDTHITVVTMGPPQAKEMLVECLAMGADEAVLASDRALGGSDTWATSNAVSAAIDKLDGYDLIFAGRQAIDGDTAQVGPQVAEKLNIPQITYAEEIQSVENKIVRIKRRLERGIEIVEGKLPLLVTVNGSAPECRPRNAKLIQKYKHAQTITEKQAEDADYTNLSDLRPYLNLPEWSVNDVNADVKQCGLSGSPTKVKKIESVVFQAKESKTLQDSDQEIEDLMIELITNHTIG